MKKILIIGIFAIMLNAPAMPQGWEKSYGGAKDDIAYDVIKVSDGGYVAVGSTNSFGAGGTDVFVVKISSTGVLKWTKVIGGTANDAGYSVAEASNGDILIAGTTESFGAGSKDVYVIKLNASGGIKWTKTYGTAGSDEARTVIISANRYFISGSSNGNFYLVKTDLSGIALWEKNYGSVSSETCYDMVRTYDNMLVMAGHTAGYGNNHVYVVKTDLNGDTLFTRNFYEGTSSPGATGIAETNDHGLVMTGFNYSGSGYGDLFLLKISSTGSQVFNTIGTALANSGTKVCANSDGGATVVGDYCNFGCAMEILKYNTTGTEQWHNSNYQYAIFNSYATFSGGYSIRKISSGYIACGYTRLPSGNNSDFMIVKTDTAGVSQPALTLSTSGPTTFCSPGNVTLTAPAGFLSYQWCFVSTTHQLTYIAGANTNSYTASVSGYYACLMKDANNDLRKASVYVSVIPISPATITTSGPAAFCAQAGGTVTLNANPSSGFTYQWKLNGTNINGANYNNYIPTTSGNYSVFISNSCTSSTSANMAVNIAAPPPAPVISYYNGIQPTSVQCPNGGGYMDGVMQVSQVAGATYQWFHNGALMNGATNYAVFPYYNNENYTCSVTTACGSATSAPFMGSYTTFTQGSALISASGPTSGCGVSSVTLSLGWTISPMYQWYLDGSPIPGATLASYLATASGTYTCDYNDDWCGPSQSQSLQIILTASPAASISASGPTSVCIGPVTLNASPTGAGITYSWYKDNVVIPAATSASYAASTSGNYTCKVTQTSCGLSVSNNIYVSVGVPVNNTITGATTICSGTSTTLSVSGPQAGQTFQWLLNGANISGATSSSYSANAAGNYKCNITNSCGTVTSNIIAVTVNQSPTAAITGNTVICPGGFVTLTANSGAGLTYQWYNFNNVIGGATQQSYNATSASQFKVRVTASNGCMALSNIITTTAGSLPAASVNLSQYPVMCNGETIQLSAPSNAGNSYQWKKNGININGATSNYYTTSDSGLYSVTVTNICGTSSAASPYPIKLKSKPAATITPMGPTSFCNGDSVVLSANTGSGFIYSWKKNGGNITSATGSSYAAKTAGTYKVTVTNSNGCSKTSANVVVTVPCREEELISVPANDITASVYPNPYAETFTLYIDGIESDVYHVTIKDIMGRTVAAEKSVPAGNEVQLGNNLSPGFYFVELISADKRKVLRVEKM